MSEPPRPRTGPEDFHEGWKTGQAAVVGCRCLSGAKMPNATINRDRLKRMVQDLPPTRKNIVLMRCADDLTWAEIGEVVGLSADRVKAIYESVVRSFKRQLSQ